MWLEINGMPIVAFDWEMVGIQKKISKFKNYKIECDMLARVTIVDFNENILIDTLVAPQAGITNYRTKTTGFLPEHFYNVPSFEDVSNLVTQLLAGKIVIGHGLQWIFNEMKIFYPKKYLRDTAKFELFCIQKNGRRPTLKELAKTYLQKDIQIGVCDSIENAMALINIYKKNQEVWENQVAMSVMKIE